MGRRCRHLNPVHAGASAAYDARFVVGSNGVGQQNWPGRVGSGRTLTQATSGNRPIYRATVSAAANQPGIEFNRSNNHWMAETSSATVSSSSNPFMVISASTGGNGFIDFCQVGTTFLVGGYGNLASGQNWDFVGHAGYFAAVNASNVNSETPIGSFLNGKVIFGGRWSSSQVFRRDGLGGNYVTASISGNLRNVNSSINITDLRTGVHHAVCVIPSVYNESLMLRVAHSYAYSFKLFA